MLLGGDAAGAPHAPAAGAANKPPPAGVTAADAAGALAPNSEDCVPPPNRPPPVVNRNIDIIGPCLQTDLANSRTGVNASGGTKWACHCVQGSPSPRASLYLRVWLPARQLPAAAPRARPCWAGSRSSSPATSSASAAPCAVRPQTDRSCRRPAKKTTHLKTSMELCSDCHKFRRIFAQQLGVCSEQPPACALLQHQLCRSAQGNNTQVNSADVETTCSCAPRVGARETPPLRPPRPRAAFPAAPQRG